MKVDETGVDVTVVDETGIDELSINLHVEGRLNIGLPRVNLAFPATSCQMPAQTKLPSLRNWTTENWRLFSSEFNITCGRCHRKSDPGLLRFGWIGSASGINPSDRIR